MRRLTTWLAGAAGGLAAYRAVVRRKPPVPAQPLSDPQADPAAQLRAKLAESRDAPPEAEDAEARRRTVHAEARSALDEMRRDRT